MAAETKPHRSHLLLVEVLIGVGLLGVATFFLVRGMQRARHREQLKDIITVMELGDAARACQLVKDNPDLWSATDSHGETPLHCAAYANAKEVAELLLAKGANTEAKDNSG